MKLFFSEFQPDYEKYHFPYQVYLFKEDFDDIEQIYDSGFLPTRIDKNIFNLCRSTRVLLNEFKLSSENRRILRKTEFLKLEMHSLKNFSYDYKIGKMALDFYNTRFKKGVMSAQKIKWLFKESFYNSVFVFFDKQNSLPIGYSLCYFGKNIIHYAHPFYKIEYFKNNIGMGMMLKSIIFAKEKNVKKIYLGTCYEESALYKTQFTGFEFFDGVSWNKDLNVLKERIRTFNHSHFFSQKEKRKEMLNKVKNSIRQT